MPLSDVTRTFNLADYLGNNFNPKQIRVELVTNAENNVIADNSTGEIRVGGGEATVAANGDVTVTTWAPGPDANPKSWQTTLRINFVDKATRERKSLSLGPYTITTSGLLTALIEEQQVPAEYLTVVTQQLDAYEAAGSAAAETAAASATSAAASAETAVNAAGTAAVDAAAAAAPAAADAVRDELATSIAPQVTAAETARTGAETARAGAEAAQAAAEAVGDSNDTIIAGRINDPASATATALSASVEQITNEFLAQNDAIGADWLFVTAAPGAGLGVSGDWALDVTTWDAYQKVDGAWVLRGNIKGADSTEPGPAGPANTLTIGTVTTLATGEPATAAVTGAAPNQTLDLSLPRGDMGDVTPEAIAARDAALGAQTGAETARDAAAGSATAAADSATAADASADAAAQSAIDAQTAAGGGVQTVNGLSPDANGAVTLNASHVGAATPADVSTASTADRDRTNHAGTQSLDTTTDSATRLAMTAAERTKLGGVAAGATANATDAQLRDRSTHTGSQAASTITGLGTAATKNAGTASGDVPVLGTGGRLDVARLASGTPDGTKFVRDDGTLATPAGGGGGGAALARTVYHGPTQSATSYTYTGNTATIIDATNLSVTFVAPASGKVIIALTATGLGPSSGNLLWSLKDGATDVPKSNSQMAATTPGLTRMSTRVQVEALTPGQSYTYAWAHRSSTSNQVALHVGEGYYSGSATSPGPAIMEVYPA
jgi:hypothetical protein